MTLLNRTLVTLGAVVVVVGALALLLLPLETLDTLLRMITFVRAQALLYLNLTRWIGLGLLLIGLLLLALEIFLRQPTLVPVQRTGSGQALLDLRTIERAIDRLLGRLPAIQRGRAIVTGYTEGVAIRLDLHLQPTLQIANTLAAIHAALREEVEERLGVAIIDLKSTVIGQPYPGQAQSITLPANDIPAWDTRELRRRLERSLLNQPGVADLEATIGYHPDGASLFLHLFAERDARVPELIAHSERLARSITEEDFRLQVYDLRVTVQSIA